MCNHVLTVHLWQVESFILARDLFLKPGGQLLPSAGHIFFCPFSDEGLYNETDQKAQFFNNTLFGKKENSPDSPFSKHGRADLVLICF